MLVRTMQRYPQIHVHKSVPAGKASRISDEDVSTRSAGVSEQINGNEAERDTGRVDAPAHSEKGRVVMLPYPISANRYWRNFRGRMVVSSEAKAYKAKVIWTFEALEVIPTFLPVELSMKLHPKLTTKGKASRTLIDLDNCIKVCLDALQGALYMNDNQVIKLTAEIGEPVLGGGLSVGVTVA